jgi:ABC-type taurine transport system substrate-binding protein
MAAVVGRSVEIGSSGATPMITLRARPYPIKILSQIADISGAEQIIVRSSIARPEDLYGKKIAIMKNTGSQALFESFVKAYDFDASRVELVYMAPTEMIASFSRGDVDAIAVWEPFTTQAVQRQDACKRNAIGNSRQTGRPANLWGSQRAVRDGGIHSEGAKDNQGSADRTRCRQRSDREQSKRSLRHSGQGIRV